jgi:uncharacterized protein (TIGR02099 family)
MHSDLEQLEQQLRPRERAWLRAARYAGWTLVGIYFLAALGVLALRYLVLPNVDAYTERIAASASQALGEKVTIGHVAAEWVNLHPRLQLSEVRIFDRQGREALRLPHVDVTVAWRSLVYGRPILRSLVLDAPDLQIRRDATGRIYVAGLEVRRAADEGPGIADAILDMNQLLIRDASVQWDDELRRAPPLKLERLSLLVENSGRHHRFAIGAEPPPAYAAPLDIRGELIGRSIKTLDAWDGRVYVSSDFVDLAVWSAWIDYPFEISGGRGALRLWATLRDWMPTAFTADVSLAEVSARMGAELPRLELKWVEGRIGAREVVHGFELMDLGTRRVSYEAFARRLGMATASGATFDRADFQAQWEPGSGKQPPQGRATASSVDLAPLAVVGETLPLPRNVRTLLARTAPRGRMEDVSFAWTGDVENPATYNGRARFRDLGMTAYEMLPGFANLGGSVEFTERGGTLVLQGAHTTVEQSHVFPDGPLDFDTLSGQVGWATPAPGRVDVRVDSVNLANAHLTASVSGTMQRTADGNAEVDFAARLPRADGAQVYRYIPNLEPDAAVWLKRGIVAAAGTDGRVRIKGAMRDYPFEDPKKGVFEASMKFANATLDYAEGWPRLTGLAGEFSLGAGRIQIQSARGGVYGVQLGKVTATLNDIFNARVPTRLVVQGQAEGTTSDFLRFIAESPVDRFTDRTFRGWSAEGRGRLALNLDFPLNDVDHGRVSGGYQIIANAVVPGMPEFALSQVNGRVDFTEGGVTAKGVTGLWLGGPVSVDVVTRAGSTQVTGQGTVNVPAAMKTLSLPYAQRISGTTAFRFAAAVKGAQQSLTVESSLQGVAIDLPPPLDKPAADAWPLRVDRTTGAAAGLQVLDVTLAKIVNARAQIRVDGPKWQLERAAIGVGDVGVALPERPGVFVSANLKTLDLDRFIDLPNAAEGGGALDVGAISLRAGELIVGGKRFHDVTARVLQVQPTRWQATVAARELTGDISYGSDGKGAVVAKLKRLVQPEAADPAASTTPANALESLPALEVTAESYVYRDRDLGRLELRAVNERRGWRVERASLTSVDCNLEATGLWQPRTPTTPQSTDFDFSIAASNIGGCLDRIGYPETVKGGTASLQGQARWMGPVYAIDYPSLNGKVTIAAEKGQFVKVRPGIGKLLGVLSLQSLPRRISLDFRDVFSEGFAFDSIRGVATIEGGLMRTDDLTMIGPAANVALKGSVDLARETQDLTVRVVPVVGDSVAAAAGVALLNPIIGAGALLAQRILKDPIGQMFAFEYHVTGGWEDPRVEKINAAVATRRPNEPTQ